MAPYRILVTGWRDWPEDLARFIELIIGPDIRTNLFYGRPVTVVQGECPHGGVDLWAASIADTLGARSEGHPAEERGGRILGPARNTRMVALGADVCHAFPGPSSRGTWDCLTKAAKAGIPTHIWPLEYARAVGDDS